MKIIFANMGHGETIYIQNNQEEYIRDFGEYSKRPHLQSACHVDDILNHKCHGKNCIFSNIDTPNRFNAILSHPHKDHFSGFEELFHKNLPNKMFKTCFLSKIIQPNALSSSEFKKFICRIFLFAKTNNKFGKFLLHLPVMSALSQNLIFCSAMDCLPFQVFTPIESIVADSLSEIREENIYSKFETSFIDKINQIIRIIGKYIRNEKVDKQEAGDDYNRIRDLIKNKNDKDVLCIKNNSILKKVYDWTSRQLDNGSLSFAMSDQDSSWLFLGDNDDSVLKKAFHKNPPSVYYCGIKTAHHGTRGARALLKNGVHSSFCVMCTGVGHGTLSMPQDEYISKTSHHCFASDCLHRKCKSNCIFHKIRLYKSCRITYDNCKISMI